MSPPLIRDLMTVGVPTCPAETPVIDLAKKMLAKDWEAVVVLESEQGHAIGYVSQKEIIEAYAANPDACPQLTAEDILHESLPTAPPDIPLLTAAQLMLDQGVRVLYLTHHAGGIEYPAAWLTFEHLLRHLTGDDVKNLGIQAAREAPLEAFIRRRDEARARANRNKEF